MRAVMVMILAGHLSHNGLVDLCKYRADLVLSLGKGNIRGSGRDLTGKSLEARANSTEKKIVRRSLGALVGKGLLLCRLGCLISFHLVAFLYRFSDIVSHLNNIHFVLRDKKYFDLRFALCETV